MPRELITVEDTIALVIPPDLDRPDLTEDPDYTLALQGFLRLIAVHEIAMLPHQGVIRRDLINAEWVISRDILEVERALNHACGSCQAARERMIAQLKEHPTQSVAVGQIVYTEVDLRP